nr:hypothetical protein [uncultured bacterium]
MDFTSYLMGFIIFRDKVAQNRSCFVLSAYTNSIYTQTLNLCP